MLCSHAVTGACTTHLLLTARVLRRSCRGESPSSTYQLQHESGHGSAQQPMHRKCVNIPHTAHPLHQVNPTAAAHLHHSAAALPQTDTLTQAAFQAATHTLHPRNALEQQPYTPECLAAYLAFGGGAAKLWSWGTPPSSAINRAIPLDAARCTRPVAV